MHGDIEEHVDCVMGCVDGVTGTGCSCGCVSKLCFCFYCIDSFILSSVLYKRRGMLVIDILLLL